MNPPIQRTPAGEALTDLTLDIFRVNNLLLTAGDRLVDSLGLTSARWQILGAIARAPQPGPVAWIARNLGAKRQNVQRIVNFFTSTVSSPSRPTPTIAAPNSSCSPTLGKRPSPPP